MPTDTERMEFLERLRNRTVFVTKDDPDYYMETFIRISGPDKCNISVFDHNGDGIADACGKSIREAIDDAIYAVYHK